MDKPVINKDRQLLDEWLCKHDMHDEYMVVEDLKSEHCTTLWNFITEAENHPEDTRENLIREVVSHDIVNLAAGDPFDHKFTYPKAQSWLNRWGKGVEV